MQIYETSIKERFAENPFYPVLIRSSGPTRERTVGTTDAYKPWLGEHTSAPQRKSAEGGEQS
jgi:hypothetical protein